MTLVLIIGVLCAEKVKIMIAKIVAIAIFLAMFLMIILDKFERQYVSLAG